MKPEERKAIDALLDGLTEKPEPAEPVTTVTVWSINKELSGSWYKETYKENGTPIIPRIIAETLEQDGVMAIKVECTEEFDIDGFVTFNIVYIWGKRLGKLSDGNWEHGNYYCQAKRTRGNIKPVMLDSDIESVIIAYLEKQKRCIAAEIAEFYTCELAGEKVRAYEDEDGDIVAIFHDSYMSGVLYGCPNQARYLCKKAGIPIMSYSESKGNFEPPKGE